MSIRDRIIRALGGEPHRKLERRDSPHALAPRGKIFAEMAPDGKTITLRTGAFDAASSSRLNWMPGGLTDPTPDAGDIETMRNRLRQQIRNNPLARAAIEVPVQNVVTHKCRPQFRVRADDPNTIAPRFKGLEITEEMARRAAVQFEAAWPIFAKHVDPGNRLQIEDLAFLLFRAFKTDGEVLLHRTVAPLTGGRQFQTAFEVIEIDRLRTPSDKHTDASIDNGIELDENGAPVAYWIMKTHPASSWSYESSNFRRIPAEEIRHLYRMDRPGQTRAQPPGAVVLQGLRDLKDLQDATILKAQHSASHTAVAETRNPEAAAGDYGAEEEEKEDVTYTEIPIITGKLNLLPIGEKFYEFKSDHPTATYESFTKGCKRDIGAGVGISGLALTRDGSDVNYSSMRGLYLGDRMGYLIDRAFLKRHGLDWVTDSYADEAVLAGWVEAPYYVERRDSYTATTWHFGAWGWVDPTKEVAAEVAAVAGNIKTLDEVVQAEGGDAEEVIDANLRAEAYLQKRRKELGLKAPTPFAPAAPPKGRPPEPDDDEEDEDEEERSAQDLARRITAFNSRFGALAGNNGRSH